MTSAAATCVCPLAGDEDGAVSRQRSALVATHAEEHPAAVGVGEPHRRPPSRAQRRLRQERLAPILRQRRHQRRRELGSALIAKLKLLAVNIFY